MLQHSVDGADEGRGVTVNDPAESQELFYITDRASRGFGEATPRVHVISGDGYVELADGSRRWGLFGAAGVLLRAGAAGPAARYLVAKRSALVHLGGTWGVPGGALHQGEPALDGALRELAEETGYVVADFLDLGEFVDDLGGWSYRTFLLGIPAPFSEAPILNWETDELRWATASELHELELFEAFRVTLQVFEIL